MHNEMATVVIALGSNLQNRLEQLRQAKQFLHNLSETPIVVSAIYASEPIGPSEFEFLNAAIRIETQLSPDELLAQLKTHEQAHGRSTRHPKWTARTIDLDIISYDHLVIETDTLIIPHPEYTKRLFVLLPLKDVHPLWADPITKKSIDALVEEAPGMTITQTDLSW